jgi:hypothetical protein
LYLEEPYGCVYSNAQRAASLFELLDGELRERYALSGADLLVNTARISIRMTPREVRTLPVDTHRDLILDAIVWPAVVFVMLRPAAIRLLL